MIEDECDSDDGDVVPGTDTTDSNGILKRKKRSLDTGGGSGISVECCLRGRCTKEVSSSICQLIYLIFNANNQEMLV